MSDEDDIAPWPAPTRAAPAMRIGRDGVRTAGTRLLAAETPVSITYNGLAHAVMMASPSDLDDFVTGFSLTEGIVARPGEIESIVLRPMKRGVLAQAWIAPERAAALTAQRRTLVGQTGCGLCGIVELDNALRRDLPPAARPACTAKAIARAVAELPARQSLNAQTGAVHAAAFADAQGALLAVREDVGRHNALDKLIGHLARQSDGPPAGFAVVTSRISFELVQKCLAWRIGALIGISAPTALALALAVEHRLVLAALARADGFQVFNDPDGLLAG